jgi:hypothetical protein
MNTAQYRSVEDEVVVAVEEDVFPVVPETRSQAPGDTRPARAPARTPLLEASGGRWTASPLWTGDHDLDPRSVHRRDQAKPHR